MDDLNGLDWSTSLKKPANTAPTGSTNYYPVLRPTPSPQNSGRNTPLSQASGPPKPTPFPPPKSSTPDSFANLVSFGSSKQNNLTLQEHQERLQEERRARDLQSKKDYEAQFGNAQFLDGLEAKGQSRLIGSSLPRNGTAATGPANYPQVGPVGAKNASPVAFQQGNLPTATNQGSKANNPIFDAATPLPRHGDLNRSSESGSATLDHGSALGHSLSSLDVAVLGDDDDPFGLANIKPANSATATNAVTDDDDILGDLAKPVEEIRQPSPLPEVGSRKNVEGLEHEDPWDKAVSELVDMGFTAEQSRRALAGTGLDIQAAVSYILDEAHQKSKQKQQRRTDDVADIRDSREFSQDRARARLPHPRTRDDDGALSRSPSRNTRNSSPGGADADLAKAAAAMGSNIFKTANSLWKTSQKKVQKAVSEFQQEADSTQPRWMREAAERDRASTTIAPNARKVHSSPTMPQVTDEALLLESGGRPPPKRNQVSASRLVHPGKTTSRDLSPVAAGPFSTSERSRPIPRWQSEAAPPASRAQAIRQMTEEQSTNAYISPARRKKLTQDSTKPQASVTPTHPDSSLSVKQAPITPQPEPKSAKTNVPTPSRVETPRREIPSISPAALATSTQYRLAGTSHFKRGDYAAAQISYSSSLAALPASHPISMILLCNRALTSLKTGVPKSAIVDADAVIQLIGPSRGENEQVDLGVEGQKSMKEIWGKALMRKAEALEQMEKWKDAADAWRVCVESNVGAGTAIQGRTRCERALAPKPVAKAAPRAPKPKVVASSAMQDLRGGNSQESEAVGRLRQANLDAEKADEERFALTDAVNERISQWRDGKRDNLRALIGSLESVLWEGSGWKKVGMNELLQNNKVKINYLKAIGKCHPDKLPQDANTEVKLIAALVFSTLNESWDKFKEQNNM